MLKKRPLPLLDLGLDLLYVGGADALRLGMTIDWLH